jgi:AraC-like DNA-binding protein
MDSPLDLIFGEAFRAEVVFAGTRCTQDNLLRDYRTGALHFVRAGRAEVLAPSAAPLRIEQPSLVFFPHAGAHWVRALDDDGIDMVCAFTNFGEGFSRAAAMCFPERLVLPLAGLNAIRHTLEALFAEACSDAPGSKQLADRLCEVVLACVARHALQSGLLQGGVLAAAGDARIGAAVAAIHSRYRQALDVEVLAREAGMSRTRFVERFKSVVGSSPHGYLVRHRIGVAQQLLARRVPVKVVAERVGYGTASAFVRSFKSVVGVTPTAWAE